MSTSNILKPTRYKVSNIAQLLEKNDSLNSILYKDLSEKINEFQKEPLGTVFREKKFKVCFFSGNLRWVKSQLRKKTVLSKAKTHWEN